jgi:CSLREA domain-containing protein
MRSEQLRKLQGKSRDSRYRRYVALFVAAFIAALTRNVNAQATPPRLSLSPASQFDTSYKGSVHAQQAMSARPSALSMAAADLDGDAVTDLAIGFAAPGGGLIAIHHGNIDAFAPQSEKSFWAMTRGEFPSPYLSQADLIEVPVRPDFLSEGDLIGSRGSALAAAARGGNSIVILSRNESGVMQVQQTITVPGSITAMDVHDLARAKFEHLVVGVRTATGPRLLVFTGSHAGLSQTGSFPLPADATSFASGILDSEGVPALLVVAGGEISILHSRSQTLEQVRVPFTVAAAAVGRFLHDRSPLFQMALLDTDGSLHIMAQDAFDSTPYTLQEMQAHRRAQIAQRLAWKQQKGKTAPASAPAPGRAVTWREVESDPRASAPDSSGKIPLMFRTRISNNGADDVLLLSTAKLSVLIHPTSQPGESVVQDRTDMGADAVAAVPVRVNFDARSGLVYMKRGQTSPSIQEPQGDPTFTVNSTADALHSGACAAQTAGECTLREAIVEANNGASGTYNIMIPAGTYTLTVARVNGTEDGTKGTLDIGVGDTAQTVNLVGAGQNTTIIQAGTNSGTGSNPNGVDKVFSFNQDINAYSDTTVSVSNLTIQNGYNRGDYTTTFDGAGGAFDCDTGSSGNASVTLTNVTLNQNYALPEDGGGFANFNDNGGTGSVTVTNSIIENNKAGGHDGFGYGGGASVEDGAFMTMTNTTVSGNSANENGGGIGDNGAGDDFPESGSPVFVNNQVTLHGVTVTNNTAGTSGSGVGGGVYNEGGGMTIDQESVVSGNTASAGDGGGIFAVIYSNNALPAFTPFNTTFSNITVTGNSTTGASGSTGYGGGIKINGGLSGFSTFTMNYSRIAGNSALSGQGQQFSWEAITGETINITENWWGTNADPTSTSNPAVEMNTSDGVGTIDYAPWILFTMDAASPATVEIGQTSTLTADVTHDSSGSTAALSGHLAVFDDLPVTFSSASGGSITTTQPAAFVPGGSGQATSTFRAGGSGGTVTVNATFDGVEVSTDITVDVPPSITSTSSATGEQNLPFNFSVTTTGYPTPITLSVSNVQNPIAGINIPSSGTGTLAFTGTPTASGTSTFTITASNGVSPNATQNFTLTVVPPPSFSSTSSTTFIAGTPGSFSVTTTGGVGALTLAVSNIQSAIPGVNIPANGTGTIAITGTPTGSGVCTFTITATDSLGGTASQNFTLTVDLAPSITSANGTTFTVGVAGSFTVTSAAGTYPAATFSTTSTLPTGVTLSSAGLLSGTPAAGTSGVYAFTITAGNDVGTPSTQNFTLTIVPDNILWIGNPGGTTSAFMTNGSPYLSTAESYGGTGVAIDSSGNIWSLYAGGDSIAEFSSNGTPASNSPISGPALAGGASLAIDGSNQVWIPNSTGGTLAVFNSGGTQVTPDTGYTVGTNAPTSIAIDISGNVWIANSGSDSVTKVLGAAAPTVPLAAGVANGQSATEP